MKRIIFPHKTNSVGQGSVKTSSRGFTLIELMMVVVIIGILSSIGTVSMSRMIIKAEEARLKVMLHNINFNVESYVMDYDLKHRWTSRSYDIRYLNGKLEKVLENKEYDNIYGHRNPFSKSKVILNYGSIASKFKNPAVFITNASKYSFDKIKPRTITKDLKGSVVVYLANDVNFIDIFYIDIAGKKSMLNLRIEETAIKNEHHDD